jgi:hypothetical protein
LRADARFDPAHFEQAAPRLTLEEALVKTLEEHGAPLHFTLLTEKLNALGFWSREASPRNVHSRLGAHPQLFVCVDRGTYGLLWWGLEDQRRTRDNSALIADLIEEFLKARGEPTPSSEIVAYVLARKRAHDYSVVQRVQNDPKFYRSAKGIYGLSSWLLKSPSKATKP